MAGTALLVGAPRSRAPARLDRLRPPQPSSTGTIRSFTRSVPPAARAVTCRDGTRSATPSAQDVKIKVIGLGGGGGNAVNRMVEGGVQVRP